MTSSNHVLFWLSCKHDRPLLRMKSDFLKEWYERFHSARKKGVKCVGDKGQDEKMRWTVTETDKGRNFLFTKFSVDLFLTERKIFHIKDKNRPLLRKKLNFLKNKIRSFTFREKKVYQGRLARLIFDDWYPTTVSNGVKREIPLQWKFLFSLN